jgi:mannonate dehydratase
VFDWLRSDLSHVQKDGARALAYDEQAVLAMDPMKSELSLPGWDESYTKSQLKALLAQYAERTEDDLRRSFAAFLEAVVPVAEQSGVRLAVHPDDPPWSIFGLPRIVSTEDDLAALLSMQKSEANGITFCTGSLGVSAENDLVRMADRFAERISFLHLRNILRTGPRQFEEVAHPTACGSNDLFSIVRALVSHGFDGYVRPDHGRMIWGEQGRGGYGLYDRALGAAYITGLFEGVTKMGGYHE